MNDVNHCSGLRAPKHMKTPALRGGFLLPKAEVRWF